MIDIGTGANVRVKAYTDRISTRDANEGNGEFNADIHLDSWWDTKFLAAGCTWLDLSNRGPLDGFQWGTVNSSQMFAEKQQKVKFPRQPGSGKGFNSPPNVIVWLRSLDVAEGQNTRFEAFVTDITTRDFTLHLRSWGGTLVYDTAVDWIAVSTDNPEARVGQFTPEGAPSELDGGKIGYTEKFDFDKPFSHPPRVLVALNKLDVGNEKYLRIEANAQNITEDGFEMVINSWDDTVLYSGAAAYIAIEDLDS